MEPPDAAESPEFSEYRTQLERMMSSKQGIVLERSPGTVILDAGDGSITTVRLPAYEPIKRASRRTCEELRASLFRAALLERTALVATTDKASKEAEAELRGTALPRATLALAEHARVLMLDRSRNEAAPAAALEALRNACKEAQSAHTGHIASAHREMQGKQQKEQQRHFAASVASQQQHHRASAAIRDHAHCVSVTDVVVLQPPVVEKESSQRRERRLRVVRRNAAVEEAQQGRAAKGKQKGKQNRTI
jgi:hypothetical protein